MDGIKNILANFTMKNMQPAVDAALGIQQRGLRAICTAAVATFFVMLVLVARAMARLAEAYTDFRTDKPIFNQDGQQGHKILSLLLALLFTTAALLSACSPLQSAESIARSMAEIETARAMGAQADATKSAVDALGTKVFMDDLKGVLIVVLLIILVGVVFYVYRQNMKMRMMQLAAQTSKPAVKWASGPNAGWRKLGDSAPAPAALPQPTMNDMMGMMTMSVMAMMTKALGGQVAVQQPPSPALLAQSRQAASQVITYDDGQDYQDFIDLEPQGGDMPSSNLWEEMFQ